MGCLPFPKVGIHPQTADSVENDNFGSSVALSLILLVMMLTMLALPMMMNEYDDYENEGDTEDERNNVGEMKKEEATVYFVSSYSNPDK